MKKSEELSYEKFRAAVGELLLWTYFLIMFVVMPLAMRDYYYKLGDFKYEIFLKTTIVFLCLAAFWWGWPALKNIKSLKIKVFSFSPDWLMLIFAIAQIPTFLVSVDRKVAFFGAPGWNMGLLTVALLFGVFLVFKNVTVSKKSLKGMLVIAGLSSEIVFLIGILHRFLIDPFGIYSTIQPENYLRFLSTIGQATWYSSFLCMFFPLGIAYFYLGEKRIGRVFSGIYSVIALWSLITQNSDSAFASLAGVLLLLLFISFSSLDRMIRFIQVILLVSGSFASMGLIEKLNSEKMVTLGEVSIKAAQGIPTWVVLTLCVAILPVLMKYRGKITWNIRRMKIIRNILFVLLGVFVVSVVLLIAANTLGYLNLSSDYLMLDEKWGNNRGFIWIFSCRLYAGMPLINKIFGIGQDSYGTYAYNYAGYADYLNHVWGNDQLLCAHNEFLNLLVCDGIVGLLAFGGVIVSGIKAGLKCFAKNGNSALTLGMTLCVVSYTAHIFFCYSQIVCTSYLFVFMALILNCSRKK